jgi:hypothetical protein
MCMIHRPDNRRPYNSRVDNLISWFAASVMVTAGVLVQKTAKALGLEPRKVRKVNGSEDGAHPPGPCDPRVHSEPLTFLTLRGPLLAAFQYLVVGTVGATFYVIGVGVGWP